MSRDLSAARASKIENHEKISKIMNCTSEYNGKISNKDISVENNIIYYMIARFQISHCL